VADTSVAISMHSGLESAGAVVSRPLTMCPAVVLGSALRSVYVSKGMGAWKSGC
jgi:hypothetical protein